MTHLNWKSEPLGLASSPHSRYQTQLELMLTRPQIDLLRTGLGNVLAGSTSAELRLDLPQKWTLFWKCRGDAPSRLHLAHPQADEWVAALALSKAHLQSFSEQLNKLQNAGDSVALTAHGTVGFFTNFELLISLAPHTQS